MAVGASNAISVAQAAAQGSTDVSGLLGGDSGWSLFGGGGSGSRPQVGHIEKWANQLLSPKVNPTAPLTPLVAPAPQGASNAVNLTNWASTLLSLGGK